MSPPTFLSNATVVAARALSAAPSNPRWPATRENIMKYCIVAATGFALGAVGYMVFMTTVKIGTIFFHIG